MHVLPFSKNDLCRPSWLFPTECRKKKRPRALDSEKKSFWKSQQSRAQVLFPSTKKRAFKAQEEKKSTGVVVPKTAVTSLFYFEDFGTDEKKLFLC